MKKKIVVLIRELIVDAAGYFSGEFITSKLTDNKYVIAVGTALGWIAGIQLNQAVDKIDTTENNNSVDYKSYISEKMKYREDHMDRYKKHLSDKNYHQR